MYKTLKDLKKKNLDFDPFDQLIFISYFCIIIVFFIFYLMQSTRMNVGADFALSVWKIEAYCNNLNRLVANLVDCFCTSTIRAVMHLWQIYDCFPRKVIIVLYFELEVW